jgi:hypothetical protein
LVHPFEQIFEFVEPALPEAGHSAGPVGQRRQRTDLRAVMRLTAFVAVAHQPGPFQNAEMFRDVRLRNPGARRQRRDRLVAVAAQPLEDRPPCRIGKRFNDVVRSSRSSGGAKRNPGTIDRLILSSDKTICITTEHDRVGVTGVCGPHWMILTQEKQERYFRFFFITRLNKFH